MPPRRPPAGHMRHLNWSIFLLVPLVCLASGQDCDSGGGTTGNIPPFVFAGAVPNEVEVGAVANLVAFAYDFNPGDLPNLTYDWALVDVEGGASVSTISNDKSSLASFVPPTAGEYTFTCTVSDGKAFTVSGDVLLTAVEDDGEEPPPPPPESNPPVIEIAEAIGPAGYPGQQIELHGLATDPDGDPVWYRWWHQSGPYVNIHDSNMANAYFTSPNVNVLQDMVFLLEVGDNHGATSTQQVPYTASPWPFLSVDHDSSHDCVWPGLTYTYTIALFNNSYQYSITGVVVDVSVDSGVDVIGQPNEFTLYIPSIAPRQTAYENYTAVVGDDYVDPQNPTRLHCSSASVTINEFVGNPQDHCCIWVHLDPVDCEN